MIPNLAVGVDHERLGRDLGAELASEHALPVAHNRKLQAEIARVGLHLAVAQVGIDADTQPFDRPGRKRIDQSGERRAVAVGDRTFRRIKDDRRGSVERARPGSIRRPSKPANARLIRLRRIGPQDRHAGREQEQRKAREGEPAGRRGDVYFQGHDARAPSAPFGILTLQNRLTRQPGNRTLSQ